MCRQRGRENHEVMQSISKDIYISDITKSISKYIKHTFRTKIIFQIIFGALTSILVVTITISFIILLKYLVNQNVDNKINDTTYLSTVITACVTYGASLIGMLTIIVKYMFNKEDMNDNTQLIKTFLDDDDIKNQTPLGKKTINQITESTGLEYLLNSNVDDNGDDRENK